MKKLSENWITEHLMDFEYKKYVLLDYLQNVTLHFNEKKLYPDLTELITHYKNLTNLKDNTLGFKNNFQKKIKNIDWNNMKFVYHPIEDEEWINELNNIIDFSMPLMKQKLNEGKSVFDFVEQHILFDTIGILPLNKQEGYFILNPFQSKSLNVYNYCLSSVPYQNEVVYGLNTSYFSTYTTSLSKPVDKIKQEIIDANPDLPNPATFLFKAKTDFPKEETFLPVAKRMLYNNLINTKI